MATQPQNSSEQTTSAQNAPGRTLARWVKRTFDILVAALMLLVLAPILLLVALAIRIKLGSPVLFFHERPGLQGKPFRLVKFRTMLPDSRGDAAEDAARITPFGRVLRSTSLDELPELYNVLCGEMSLVGPRPLLMEYLPLYSKEQAQRHLVRPGITGWAQVNGRNALSWEERFQHDVWYAHHHTLLLDLRILAMTVLQVIKRSDISAEGHATAPKFTGTGSEDESVHR